VNLASFSAAVISRQDCGELGERALLALPRITAANILMLAVNTLDVLRAKALLLGSQTS